MKIYYTLIVPFTRVLDAAILNCMLTFFLKNFSVHCPDRTTCLLPLLSVLYAVEWFFGFFIFFPYGHLQYAH